MTRFSDLKLDPKVLKAIEEAGYDKPTPIQAGAIPPALEGRDVLGIAQTGTGKTAGFTLPVVTLLGRGRARARMPRSLVLCPTRELAAQVAEHFDLYAKYTRLTRALLIGGVSFGEQDKLIDRGVDVLIATPGRLLDHFERGKLLLTGVQIMVVDEADRMLDMGFIPDIERIFQLTPFTRQTLFFSATMAPEIERLTNTFLHAPERIEVARQATASETIEQRLVAFTPSRKDQTARQKRELLRCLIDAEGEALTNAMIFANRKTDVDIVAKSLKTHGYDAAPIHGDLNQGQRTRTLDDFREGRLRFLVASDVAARGLDIPAVSHVFNFDLPGHAEDYVHRIGRTGRAGREGIAISLTVPDDDKVLSAIENLLKQPLPRADLPEGFSTSAPRSSRSPSEGGSRRRRSDSRPAPEPAKADTARPQAAKPSAAEPGAASSRQGAAPDRAPQPRNTGDNHRGRGRQGRDDQHGRHDAITGMGGHVPEFLTRSFLDALAATARNDDLDDENDSTPDHEASAATPIVEAQTGTAAETAADNSKNTSEAAETEPKPTRSRRRRSTASKAAEPAEDTASEQDSAADMPAAETGTDDAPAPVEDEAEKPKTTTRRRSTTRRKATESTPDSQAETGATEDGNLTVATEAGQSAPDPEPAAEEVAPEKPAAPAPRSRARKTAAAKAEADTTTEAEPEADPAPKAPARRATTRKATTTSTRKPAAAKAAKAGPAETPDAKADDAAAAAETDSAEASAATQKPAATTRSSTTKAKTTPARTAKKATTTKTAATKATAAKTSAAKATTKAAAKPKAKPAVTKAATDTTAAVEAPDAETGADDTSTA